MALLSVDDLGLRFRGPWLLDHVSCQVEAGERIGLLGRNGSGKTSFLRLLSGDLQPDHGVVSWATATAVALLPQEIPHGLRGDVAGLLAAALPQVGIEDQWKQQQQLDQTLARMQLDPAARFEQLSSGLKRRVLLARALVVAPEVLLLDEPTNHLDIEAITWLEEFLQRWSGTLIFVTHDRVFLRKLATRVLEMDRGRLFDWACDYDTFVARKEAELAAEEKQNALFDRKLAEEEAWIRQGIKARRTRNEGRVRALQEMRRLRRERRTVVENPRLRIQSAQRSGALVADVEGVSFAYDQRVILRDFSTTIMRGDKIGIIGPNGAGKTTLLRLLLGQLPPQSGRVRLGTNLHIAYFDQLREQLDESQTVAANVGDGFDTVTVSGKPRHLIGYLRDFLFTPERARTPVQFLSGGERNRVLLARLFTKPANAIVMDEPTNDLDTETLEVLESRLVEFPGSVLLVSHDREFLNNVVTSIIAFEPSGVREYVGGYDEWLRQRPEPQEAKSGRPKPSDATSSVVEREPTNRRAAPRRLKYQEKQELAALPGTIERLEAEIEQLHGQMASPDFYQQPSQRIAEESARLKELESLLSAAYDRWQELDELDT